MKRWLFPVALLAAFFGLGQIVPPSTPFQRTVLCSNTSTDASAIQNAINALGSGPGNVYIGGFCNINSTINVGNGSASQGSTIQGIVLIGLGNPGAQSVFPGFTPSPGPRLTWTGATGQPIVSINGPLQGWGAQNLYFDCQSTAGSIGLLYTSAWLASNRNLSFTNCAAQAVKSTTVPLFGSFTITNSFHNTFVTTSILVPNIAGAQGILLTGASPFNSDTHHDIFIQTDIALQGGANLTQDGVYLQVTDEDEFYDLHVFNNGANTGMRCIVYDYSATGGFPTGTRMLGVDVSTCGNGTPVAQVGTPSSAAPNWLWVNQANAMVCPTTIANLACLGANQLVWSVGGNTIGTDAMGPWGSFTPSPSCGNATFTVNSNRFNRLNKTVWFQVDFTITGIGTTCANTANIAFNAPVTAGGGTQYNIAGKEYAVSGFSIDCLIAGGGVSTLCAKADGTLGWAVNDRFAITGFYEAQ